MITLLVVLAAWVLFGLLTVLAVRMAPPDVKYWPVWCVALGPVGFVCLLVMVYRRVKRGL